MVVKSPAFSWLLIYTNVGNDAQTHNYKLCSRPECRPDSKLLLLLYSSGMWGRTNQGSGFCSVHIFFSHLSHCDLQPTLLIVFTICIREGQNLRHPRGGLKHFVRFNNAAKRQKLSGDTKIYLLHFIFGTPHRLISGSDCFSVLFGRIIYVFYCALYDSN